MVRRQVVRQKWYLLMMPPRTMQFELEMPTPEDEEPVGAFSADGADEPLRA